MLYTCLSIGEREGILCRSAIFKSSTRSDTAADKSLFARCCGQAGSDKLSGGTWEVLRRVFPSVFTDCLGFFWPWVTSFGMLQLPRGSASPCEPPGCAGGHLQTLLLQGGGVILPLPLFSWCWGRASSIQKLFSVHFGDLEVMGERI